MVRVVSSTSAARRLDAAHAFLASCLPAADVTIVGASRGAADDFVLEDVAGPGLLRREAAAANYRAQADLLQAQLTHLLAQAELEQTIGRTPGQ